MRTQIQIVLFLSIVCFAERYSYQVSEYTTCEFNEASEKYNKNCETQKVSDKQISFDINDTILELNKILHTIDSIRDYNNSDDELVRFFYTHEQGTDFILMFAFSRQYINIYEPGEWKVSYEKISSDTNYYTGSGFGINQHNIVTNYHVVEKMNSIVVKIGEEYSNAEIIFLDKDIDIAVLKLDSSVESCKIDDEILNVGDDILVYGYPKVELQGQSIKATKGIISSRFGYKDDLKTYQIDAAVQPGNSGGPLIRNGKISGVVVSRLDEGQNVNYAIKSIFLTSLLKSAGVKYGGKNEAKDCTYLVFGSDK